MRSLADEPVFTWDELTGLKRFLCIPLVARPLDSRLSDYQPLTALLDNDKPNAASTSTGKPLGPGLPLNQVSKYMPAAADRAEVDYVTWLSDETAAADVDTELEPQEDSAISKAGTAAARDERYRLTPVSESTEEFGTPAASTTAPDPLFSATEAAAQEEAQSADTDIELPEPGSSRSSVDELVVDWADAARQPAVDLDAVEVLEEEDIEHASPAKSAADLIPARDYSPSPLASTDADIAESPAAAAAPDGQ